MKKILSLKMQFLIASEDKKSLIKMIDESEVAEQVYNSNAIENSTLTLDETEKILLQIDLDRFISERELFESKNLAKVIEYIHKNATIKELDLDMVLFLHKILISNIRDDIAGRLRQEDEWVKVGNHIAPDPKNVSNLLKNALLEYKVRTDKSIIQRIATLHLRFENIHPFVDGNGRIGRVINNYLLLSEGFVPINIKFIDRGLYYDALREFDKNGKTLLMEDIVYKAMTNSYFKRLAYLDGKQIITLNAYAKQNNISHSNLINKAKRQTIAAFLEKGVWKIGV